MAESRPEVCTGWLCPIRRPPDPVGRLVCLPHAGGGTVQFRRWLPRLPESVEVLVALLPGREGRIDEPPARNLDTVVAGLAGALAEVGERLPTVVIGHSLGAFVAYELCRRVGRQLPVRHLIVCGARAPHRPPTVAPIAHLPTPEFLAAVRGLGGVPAAAFDEPRLMELVQPVLRADFALAEGYRPAAPDPLGVPLTVLGGADDPILPVAELDGWRQYSTAVCTVRVLPGGHFFTVTEEESVTDVVRGVLRSVTVG